MRALEIVLLALLLLAALRMRRGAGDRGRAAPEILAALTAIVLAAHAVLEGLRWQMTPAYALAAVVMLGGLLHRRPSMWAPPDRGRGRTAVSAIGIAVLVVTTVTATLLPVPELPQPSGPLPIGTFVTSLVDVQRVDPYAPNPGVAREIAVQIFYPAAVGSLGPVAPWISDARALSEVASGWIGLPSFALRHAELVDTHAVLGARVSGTATTYPVVVYSHGWGGFRNIHTSQLESLASHGFIVVSLDHTYGSLAAMFPDAHTVRLNPDALPEPEDVSEEVYARAARTLVATYRDDLAFVLDWLTRLNDRPDGELSGRLDLGQIGIVGHSTGGGAAVEVCATTPACRALVAYDAWVNPVSEAVLEDGMPVPTLLIGSEQWLDEQDLNQSRLALLTAASSGEVVRLRIDGLEHRDFSVLGLLSPTAAQLGLTGPLDTRTALGLMDAATVGWFRHTLLGEPLDSDVFDRARGDSPMWREDRDQRGRS